MQVIPSISSSNNHVHALELSVPFSIKFNSFDDHSHSETPQPRLNIAVRWFHVAIWSHEHNLQHVHIAYISSTE